MNNGVHEFCAAQNNAIGLALAEWKKWPKNNQIEKTLKELTEEQIQAKLIAQWKTHTNIHFRAAMRKNKR